MYKHTRLQTLICPTLVVIFSVAIALPATSANAQSLWEKRDNTKAFLFEDLKARRVGDLLTIVVSENTGFNHQDTRDMKKKTSNSSAFDFNYGVGGDIGSGSASGSVGEGSSSNREFAGDTSASTTRTFNDRFTVQVIDVLPNGNMIVSGSRDINVQGDSRRLLVTGIVRAYDLSEDNSVNSRLVANLEVKYDGKGPDQKFIKQGWLGKRVNKIWPY